MRLIAALLSALLISTSATAGGLGVQHAREHLQKLRSKQRGGIKGANFEGKDGVTRGNASGEQFLTVNTTSMFSKGILTPEFL
jgi:hypothetical protein